MDDQLIIELIRNRREDRALSQLYQLFPMVRKMLLRQGATSTQSEDLFQEALIILVRRARSEGFILRSSLGTYLVAVSRLLHLNQARKQGSIPEVFSEVEFTDENINSWVEEEERYKMAEGVLARLQDRCQELLMLFYLDRLSVAAIAARMGYSSEGSARNQKYKCLEAAKASLKSLSANQL
ncbi:MAG: sigma-70 family RNA polymerase sigma factor [Chitinophagaceae bacterium]|nr:MAG: sigma-70 family RNA polymerase sigma factor [Chitinophagaceae bacterium]